TRPALRLARILAAPLDIVLRDDRARAVDVAKLDVEVVGERLEILGAEIRRRPSDVARVRLLHGELPDWTTLGLVRGEQARTGNALQHERQLPRQIVAVVDPGVAAEAPVRRHQVRRVAGE